jgi:hypothetical protein
VVGKNLFDRTSDARITVVKRNKVLPSLTIQSPPVVYRSSEFRVRSLFSLPQISSECGARPELGLSADAIQKLTSDSLYRFQWSLSPPLSGVTLPLTERELVIPASAMSSVRENAITFTLSAWTTGHAAPYTAPITVNANVSIAPSPPHTVIAGGSRSVSVSEQLILNATISSDPDFNVNNGVPLQYLWSCLTLESPINKPCNVDPQLAVALNKPILRIPANTLLTNKRYRFTLVVRSEYYFARPHESSSATRVIIEARDAPVSSASSFLIQLLPVDTSSNSAPILLSSSLPHLPALSELTVSSASSLRLAASVVTSSSYDVCVMWFRAFAVGGGGILGFVCYFCPVAGPLRARVSELCAAFQRTCLRVCACV